MERLSINCGWMNDLWIAALAVCPSHSRSEECGPLRAACWHGRQHAADQTALKSCGGMSISDATPEVGHDEKLVVKIEQQD